MPMVMKSWFSVTRRPRMSDGADSATYTGTVMEANPGAERWQPVTGESAAQSQSTTLESQVLRSGDSLVGRASH